MPPIITGASASNSVLDTVLLHAREATRIIPLLQQSLSNGLCLTPMYCCMDISWLEVLSGAQLLGMEIGVGASSWNGANCLCIIVALAAWGVIVSGVFGSVFLSRSN